MEGRKRKLPARASARVEAVTKKSRSTPPRETSRQPTPVVIEDPLPKSIQPGKPLPTVDKQQPNDLPLDEYQSIAESKVMAESLERSRRKWVSEGIFEKFWTKPQKRRAKDLPSAEELRNPPKECMTKMGQCTITIEPHAFDAIMYTVKDMTPKVPLPLPPPPQPLYRPIIQYGPPNGIIPQHQPHQSPQIHQQHTPMQMPPQSPFINGTGAPQKPTPQSPANTYKPMNGASAPASHPPPSTPRQSPAPSPAPAKSSDPVIQMLAERAATDPDLKALMRIVADGKATPEELRKFQAHIDELTEILRRREREAFAAQEARAKAQQNAPPQSPRTQTPGQAQPMHMANKPALQAPSPVTARPIQSPAHQRQYPAPSPQYQPPLPQPQPQALRSKGPPPKPDISGVVFEFVGGNGDRYSFPKYSILEYLPGGQVVASFLIVRKGSAADAKCYDPSLDYYQPVTIRLWTNGNSKQLETLRKVVKPQEEVRRYMDDVMDNMTRAEYVLLAMRLPRDKGEGGGSGMATPKGGMEKENEEESAQLPTTDVLWNTSAYEVAKPALKKKKVERLLTEEEKYQNFIRSVSEHT